MKKSFVILAVLAGVSLLAAGCNHSTTSSDVGDFKIGTILPESGSLAFLGPPMIEAVNLAVSEVNAANAGINIVLSKGDSGTDPVIAGIKVDSHIAEGVSAVLGAASSGISLSFIDKLIGVGIVQISPSNTSPTFTTYDDKGFYFRTAPSDILQGQLLAELVVEDGAQKVAILNRADDYGRQLAKVAKDSLEKDGADAQVYEYDPEAPSYSAEAQKVASYNPDAIVLIAFEEGVKIISALIEANVGPATKKIYVSDGLGSADLGEKIDPENPGIVSGMVGLAPSTAPASGEATFSTRFAAFAPQVKDTIFSSHSYDGIIVLALAVLDAGSTIPNMFRSKINGVTKDGEKCTLFAQCAKLLKDGKNIDYDGASGPLEFVDAGEPSAGVYDIFAYQANGDRKVQSERTLK